MDRESGQRRVRLNDDQWKRSREYHQPDRPVKADGGDLTKNEGGGSETLTLTSAPTSRERLEVWGLTGWFLSVFMWRMGFWRDVVEARGRVLEVEQPGSADRVRDMSRPASRL